MMRRMLTGAAMLAVTVVAQSQDLATEVKATQAAPGIYMLEGVEGFSANMALLVGDERVVLIDDGMKPITADLVATVDELAGRPIDFIVNTHVHGDHVGSNASLSEDGTVIFAHDNVRRRLLEKPDDAGGVTGLPVVTFPDSVTFHVNGQEVRVFHVEAAHTDGDVVIHFPAANVIAAGDLLFNGMFPFIDLDSGGSVAGYLAGQRRLIELADEETVIIPGHGPLAGREDLEAEADMLLDARSRVRKLVNEGKSIDEVLAANPLADYHDAWNWGFITTERMTRTLYRSASAARQ